mmetsp:Transcript_12409/g.29209  ORF Transcript_12409/g.29209 Transcript_12409/m.29209 type:complete len:260 (+) Transcript_12409:905-1684(+)
MASDVECAGGGLRSSRPEAIQSVFGVSNVLHIHRREPCEESGGNCAHHCTAEVVLAVAAEVEHQREEVCDHLVEDVLVALQLLGGAIGQGLLVLQLAAGEEAIAYGSLRPSHQPFQAGHHRVGRDCIRTSDNQRHFHGLAEEVGHLLHPAPPSSAPTVEVPDVLHLRMLSGGSTDPEVVGPLNVVGKAVHSVREGGVRGGSLLRNGEVVHPNCPASGVTWQVVLREWLAALDSEVAERLSRQSLRSAQQEGLVVLSGEE